MHSICEGTNLLNSLVAIALWGNYFNCKPLLYSLRHSSISVEKLKRKVYRGNSRVPLYITAAGMDTDEAATQIAKMHGAYRIPTLLKQADSRSRNQPVFC